MKKISHALVTGGAGFIGSHLVDELVANGCRVTVLDNLSTGHRHNIAGHGDRIDFVEGDIRDAGLLETGGQGVRGGFSPGGRGVGLPVGPGPVPIL
jgi:nucleoside-diphosphate-sugar epimerase